MPCGDKADSKSPVPNPGRKNYAKGTLTNFIPLETMAAT